MTHKRAPRSKVKGWATETSWEGCCERRKQDRGEDTMGCVTSRVKSKVTQKSWIPYSMAQKNRRHWVENNIWTSPARALQTVAGCSARPHILTPGRKAKEGRQTVSRTVGCGGKGPCLRPRHGGRAGRWLAGEAGSMPLLRDTMWPSERQPPTTAEMPRCLRCVRREQGVIQEYTPDLGLRVLI